MAGYAKTNQQWNLHAVSISMYDIYPLFPSWVFSFPGFARNKFGRPQIWRNQLFTAHFIIYTTTSFGNQKTKGLWSFMSCWKSITSVESGCSPPMAFYDLNIEDCFSFCWWTKIRRSPVEVGSLSHDLYTAFYTSQVVQDFFHQEFQVHNTIF